MQWLGIEHESNMPFLRDENNRLRHMRHSSPVPLSIKLHSCLKSASADIQSKSGYKVSIDLPLIVKRQRFMIMKGISLILLLSLAVCCIADDQAQRIREADEIAKKDADKWEAAVNAGDTKGQAQLMDSALSVLQDAEMQAMKLGVVSAPVTNLIKTIADARCPAFMRNRLIHRITDLMSRNKDNLIYYRLAAP